MSKFEISLSKNDLEHIANGYDIKIKIDGKRFSNTNEIILKPALTNDVMAPILNYKNKIIDTEQQNIVNISWEVQDDTKKFIETLEQTRQVNLERFKKYGPTFRGGKVFQTEEEKQE